MEHYAIVTEPDGRVISPLTPQEKEVLVKFYDSCGTMHYVRRTDL